MDGDHGGDQLIVWVNACFLDLRAVAAAWFVLVTLLLLPPAHEATRLHGLIRVCDGAASSVIGY